MRQVDPGARVEFLSDELKQLATTSPVVFVKRRMELVHVEFAGFRDIEVVRQLRATIAEQRWRFGAEPRSSQDLLASAIACSTMADAVVRTLREIMCSGSSVASSRLPSRATLGEATESRLRRVGSGGGGGDRTAGDSDPAAIHR